MLHGEGHKNTFETNFPIEKSVRKAEPEGEHEVTRYYRCIFHVTVFKKKV